MLPSEIREGDTRGAINQMTNQSENPTNRPTFPRPEPGCLTPGSLGWRITIATQAYDFFNPRADRRAMAELIGRQYRPDTFEAWSVGEFLAYLPRARFQAGNLRSVVLILKRWSGPAYSGRLAGMRARRHAVGWSALCVSRGAVGVGSAKFPLASRGSRRRAAHPVLQLGLGPYNRRGRQTGRHRIGAGSFACGHQPHVIEGLVGPGNVGHDIEVHPSFKVIGAEPLSRQSRILTHPTIDVALIEAQLADNEQLLALPGMAFREPKWHEEVCVFGYPYVPGLTERPITVERGHIVHPAAEACGVDGYPRQCRPARFPGWS